LIALIINAHPKMETNAEKFRSTSVERRTPTLRPDFHRDRPDSKSGWLH